MNEPKSEAPYFGITLGGDILFHEDGKVIEIGMYTKERPKGFTNVELFAKSVRKWQYPHEKEEITPTIREQILHKASWLIELKYAPAKVTIVW